MFQDSLNREFNATYIGRVRDGPAPDGEALERVVRGLMLAQREDPQAGVEAALATPLQAPSPNEQNTPRLQQVLVSTLKDLNEPVNKTPVRYEKTHGPRKDETWAARFATRIMQWRRMMRTAPGSLVQGVVEVDSQDICGLDEEGLEVYRFVRNAAPGYIHLATPLQPELSQPQPQRVGYQIQPQHYQHYPHDQHHQHPNPIQHQRSISSGMGAQHILSSPIEKTPGSTPSVMSDTTRTTPQYPQQQHQQQRRQQLYQHREHEQEDQHQHQHQHHEGQYQGGTSSAAEGSMKRSSQDMGLPPSKRPKSVQSWEGGGRGAAAAGVNPGEGEGRIALRSGPMDVDTPQYDTMTASEETNALLRRVLNGISELGQKIDTMQTNLGQRITQLDGRLQGIQDRLHGIQDWIGIADEEEQD